MEIFPICFSGELKKPAVYVQANDAFHYLKTYAYCEELARIKTIDSTGQERWLFKKVEGEIKDDHGRNIEFWESNGTLCIAQQCPQEQLPVLAPRKKRR